MNYTSPPGYDDKLNNSNPVYQLDEGFDKLSVEDYVGEVVEDEVLYVTPQGSIVTEDFCGAFETANPLGEETSEWPFQSSASASDPGLCPGLDQPIRELAVDQVRWFYKSDTDKQWVPFSGFDSLRIEERYRQHRHHHHADLPTPNQPSASRSESSNSASTSSMDDSVYFDACSTGYSDSDSPSASLPRDHIVVRGGMYEVNIEKRKCVSIFWPGKNLCIIFFHHFQFLSSLVSK